jgi:hypothetical protein
MEISMVKQILALVVVFGLLLATYAHFNNKRAESIKKMDQARATMYEDCDAYGRKIATRADSVTFLCNTRLGNLGYHDLTKVVTPGFSYEMRAADYSVNLALRTLTATAHAEGKESREYGPTLHLIMAIQRFHILTGMESSLSHDTVDKCAKEFDASKNVIDEALKLVDAWIEQEQARATSKPV